MKKQILFSFLLIGGFFHYAHAQCLKPTPLSSDQVRKITGKWKGTYINNGAEVNLEINIAANPNNEVTCNVSNPPLAGKETMVEYFFCPGGEFHLRKYIGDLSYVFQGTPENNKIKGIVSVYDANNKRKQEGNFTISKMD